MVVDMPNNDIVNKPLRLLKIKSNETISLINVKRLISNLI